MNKTPRYLKSATSTQGAVRLFQAANRDLREERTLILLASLSVQGTETRGKSKKKFLCTGFRCSYGFSASISTTGKITKCSVHRGHRDINLGNRGGGEYFLLFLLCLNLFSFYWC